MKPAFLFIIFLLSFGLVFLAAPANLSEEKNIIPPAGVFHQPTPVLVKALFVTWPASSNVQLRENILQLAEQIDFNSLVIDIRSSGAPLLLSDNLETKKLLAELHQRNFYLIARLVVFKENDSQWYDPADRQRWRQVADISKLALRLGFDEINYDYVRYGATNEPDSSTPVAERRVIINSFFRFLKEEVRDQTGRPISLDIFGVTFTHPQAVIGQALEDAVLFFDYLMPMTYPSHWDPGSFGFENPAHHPYETVLRALNAGWEKVKDRPTRLAQLRVWIQAFNLDSSRPMQYYPYTALEIKEQIRAAQDVGCVGWALWNAQNRYEESLKNF